MLEMRFVNRSILQVVGVLFLAASPFFLSDFFSGKFGDLFNKLATASALSALVISIFNEASTNSKIHIQNVRYRLDSKLMFILRQFDLITFDFNYPSGIPGNAKGFHAFRVAIGDLLAGGAILNRSYSNFSFWEAQIVVDHINNYLSELIDLRDDLLDQHKNVVMCALDNITPVIHVYQEFYNQYLAMLQRGHTPNADLVRSVNSLHIKLLEIEPKYKGLKEAILM